MGFPAVVVSGGYSLVEVHRLRIAVASLAAEHGLWVLGRQQLWPMVSGVAAPRLWSTGSVVMVHRLRCSAARGIFPDQGLNPYLLHRQADSLPLSHQRSLIWDFYDTPLL